VALPAPPRPREARDKRGAVIGRPCVVMRLFLSSAALRRLRRQPRVVDV
jgi:hypothetical protein